MSCIGMAQEIPDSTAGHSRPNQSVTSDIWWYIILLHGATLLLAVIFGTGLGFLSVFINLLEGGGSGVGFFKWGLDLFRLLVGILIVSSPIAVYFDRKQVRDVSEWDPSWLYFLVFLGPIGWLIALVYIYKRHKYVGTP